MLKNRYVYLGGSRNLNSVLVVRAVVNAVLNRSLLLRTGCARGADSLVINAALRANASRRLVVFAAFDTLGSDVPSTSDSGSVFLAQSAGSRVFFSSFSGPARARLAARSRAAVIGSSLACWFLSPEPSAKSGSLKAAAFAARSGIPVVVFSCGFASVPPVLSGCAGSWLRSTLWGFPCWRWLPSPEEVIKV